MAPPGRRRSIWSIPAVLFGLTLLLSYISTARAASAVLGIDVGTEYLKAALVKPGIPLEIVLTKDSKRKEASALAFKKSPILIDGEESFPERLYGSDAVALAARFPEDVYSNLKSLVGVTFEGEGSGIVEVYKERYPGLSMVNAGLEGRETVAFESANFRGRKTDGEPFLVEELLAMKLKNVRANAEALAGSTVQDAVITVPPFYTAAEKRSLELAANLAGIRVLGLMSDGLAVGVNYATSRQFPVVNEGGKPEYHVIYDMGAGSTSATVLKFQGRTVKDVGKYNKTVQEVQIVGTAWDKTLGGDALNQLIVDDMVAKLAEHKKVKALGATVQDIRKHGKTMAKLWKDAERLRQVLSANTETQSSFEGIYDEDVTFKYKISRAQFEALASEHKARVQTPLFAALESAGLSLNEIDSVILHGGAIRTPFVQQSLEAASGAESKLRTNVNSDEAALFGAAFKAAGLSPSFRVKEIRTVDTPGYAVGLKWQVDGKERHQKLFTPTSQSGVEKSVPIKALEDVKLDFYQDIPLAGGVSEAMISRFETKNLTASVAQLKEKHDCGPANITTQFSVRLSPVDGLPEIVSGTVSCEVEGKFGSVVDGVKDFFGFGSKKTEQEPLKDEADGTESAAAADATEAPAADSKKEETAKDAGKSKMITINIQIESSVLGLAAPSETELTRMKNRLISFDASDKARVQREEALNTLEAFTYRARDLITDDDFIASSTDANRATLEEMLETTSDWLYGDGAEASREELKAKLKALRDLVDPVTKRRDEASKRPAAIKKLEETLEQTKSVMTTIESSLEADEAAKASASAAAESSSSSTASASSTETPVAADDDLEDDAYGSSTTSSTTSEPSAPVLSGYEAADLASIKLSYNAISTWYEEKAAAQAKLSATDDPAFSVAEIEAKANALNEAFTTVVRKKLKTMGPKPPKKETKKEKKADKKSEKKKGKKDKEEKKAKGEKKETEEGHDEL